MLTINNPKGHSEVLDIAKGFAMLMTIFCHALQRATPDTCGSYLIWKLVHEWHMPMFMMISGYLAAKSSRLGTPAYIRDKFFRLIYVWFVWRWLEWAFIGLPFAGLLPFNHYVPTSFLGNLLYFIRQPFRPMWFLMDLFLFLLVLCICKWLSRGSEKTMLGLLLAAVLVSVVLYDRFCVILNTIGGGYNKSWGFLYYDVQYFGLFALGFFFDKLVAREKRQGGSGWMSACLICVAAGVLVILGEGYITSRNLRIFLFWGRAVVECALILIGIKAMVRFCVLRRLRETLAYMGRHSLEYYTLQFLCMDCGWLLKDTNLRWAVNFVACMGICTAVIVVTDRYLPGLHKLLWGNFSFQKRDTPANRA